MIDTAENVVAKFGVSAAEQNEVALARYVQYQEALAEDRAFQRRYMVDVPVTDAGFRKQTGLLCADEGVFPTTAEGLAKLKPVKPNGSVSFGTQTHPADGNAGMIVTTRELARECSTDPKIVVELLGFGQARVAKGHMPMAVAPASMEALKHAGLTIKDVDAVKTHNPFAVNDIAFARETGFPLAKMNNYGCSLIWGHPQGPTGLRSDRADRGTGLARRRGGAVRRLRCGRLRDGCGAAGKRLTRRWPVQQDQRHAVQCLDERHRVAEPRAFRRHPRTLRTERQHGNGITLLSYAGYVGMATVGIANMAHQRRTTHNKVRRKNAMKIIGKIISAAIGAVVWQSAFAADITLRFHQFLPPQATIPSKAIVPWAQKVEKESGGRIKVQHFPSMQLGGKPPELFDQAKDGVADIVWTVLGYTPGRFPKSEVFELPFFSGLAEPASRAFQDYVEKYAMDEFRTSSSSRFTCMAPACFTAGTRSPNSKI